MDDEFTDNFEEAKKTQKAKQKEYRRKVYLAMKERKKEFTLKQREAKKAKKNQDYEEALRQKNAKLWEALRSAKQLTDPDVEITQTKGQNPFLATEDD